MMMAHARCLLHLALREGSNCMYAVCTVQHYCTVQCSTYIQYSI